MDSKDASEHSAMMPTDAVSEAAALLRGQLIALHQISDSLPVAPTIEATSELSTSPVALPAKLASTSGLWRPHEQCPFAPAGGHSEEEEEEGAVGGVLQTTDDQESVGGSKTTRSDVTSSYSSLASLPSPRKAPVSAVRNSPSSCAGTHSREPCGR